MIIIAAAIFGCLLGVRTAKTRGGKRLDLIQYGSIYAILFALIGLFVTIGIDRMAG